MTEQEIPEPSAAAPLAHTAPSGPQKVSGLSHRHYPALDGLRGLAILAVMLDHFTGGYSGRNPLLRAWGAVADAGWMGVDLFFVLSGFLITGILYDTASQQSRIRNFYARRSLRIFPLFYGILIVLLLLTPVFHFHWQAGDVAYFFYLANVVYAVAPTLQSIHPAISFVHFWSLAVEEQFYLLWPFVVWFVRDRLPLLRIAVAVLILSPVLRLILLLHFHVGPSLVRTFLLTRSDSLLIGGAVALLSRGPWHGRLPAVPVLAGSLALLALILMHSGSSAEGVWMIGAGYSLIALCGACLVYSAQFASTWTARIFDRPTLRFFGRYSYGLYLFHGCYFVYIRHKALALQARLHSALLAQLVMTVVGFGISIALAMLSYHFFEAPLLRLKRRFA